MPTHLNLPEKISLNFNVDVIHIPDYINCIRFEPVSTVNFA
jgi:hypothetical protein